MPPRKSTRVGKDDIAVTVIGGYLGAGKTTLVNHILRNSRGRRFALLVNDFGSINIDAELIENRDGDTIRLTNGCICCSIASGFGEAMYKLRASAVLPERVIIEASGVSDPMRIAQYGHLPGFVLDGVIVLADAESVRRRSRDKYVGRQVVGQLRNANLVLLNKIDLISDEQREAVQAWLRELVPDVRIAAVRNGRAPLELLFGEAAPGRGSAGPARSIDADTADHAAEYETWSYTSSEPLDEARVRSFFAGLDARVLRGKGFVLLAHDPSVRFEFQLVGKAWLLERGQAWNAGLVQTQFVLIGLPGSLNAAALDAALHAAIRSTA